MVTHRPSPIASETATGQSQRVQVRPTRRTLDRKELEVVIAGWNGSRFETFCNALLLADAPTPLQHFPRLTDRGNVADGGIDAEFDYDGPATGLLSPGRNVFQCKWRSPYDHKAAFNSLLFVKSHCQGLASPSEASVSL